MLTAGEPYRYALPKTTEAKLSKLRVRATSQRRKSGSPKGTKCQAKLPGGSRTIKSLVGVFQSEGLPPPRPLSPGERRVVQASGCAEFVAQLGAERVVPRRPSQTQEAAVHD